MKKQLLLLATTGILLSGCSASKKLTQVKEPEIETIEAPELLVTAPRDEPPYQGSETRINDLIHTKLDVDFNWKLQQLNGKATLTLAPYFYPTDELTLDAKGFQINEVKLQRENGTQMPLEYHYNNKQFLEIKLDKTYKRGEKYSIFIDYIAKPEELVLSGSEAITSDKGLYFINPNGTEPDKPKQIWTQGETESSSCWFPTIDAPNEKTTQEINITVDNQHVTLSNGKMIGSKPNPNGTRTDTWKQDIPHAPYLFMMFVGDMAVIKDKSWKGKEVSYYVEKEYQPYAMQTFGNTPEMMEFYSKLLKYDYPWDKYSQVVVRDFVSGAMENTSATIHFDQLQRTDRELLDETHEDIVAHELIHHWFGDLVTCESWANLPLNESFATYGEYLWIEHKYGKEEADKHGSDDLNIYLQESQGKKVELIRYHYADKEDMFDAHSYQKGGRILHMLRNYIGDDAFFEALSLYLHDNEYTAVEIHQLRLAFEEVTGEDLNWFFNQWFLGAGHPQMRIKHKADTNSGKYEITFTQKQDQDPFKLPIAIDVYYPNKVERKDFVIDGRESTFSFNFTEKPLFVNVDADKVMLWEKDESRDISEYVAQYQKAPKFLDRYEAIEKLSGRQSEAANFEILTKALSDPSEHIRVQAATAIDITKNNETVSNQLKNLAQNDPKSSVRAAAIAKLAELENTELATLFEKATNDPSYGVVAQALQAFVKVDKAKAMPLVKTFENEKNGDLLRSVSAIYGENGEAKNQVFFENKLPKSGDYSRYMLLQDYGKLATRNLDNPALINQAVATFRDKALNDKTWWVRMNGMNALAALQGAIATQKGELQATSSPNATELMILDSQITQIADLMKEVKANETHPRLKQLYQMMGL